MLLECVVIGKKDTDKARKILATVASELIRNGKIKFDYLDSKQWEGKAWKR